jgi:hypothetical protein
VLCSSGTLRFPRVLALYPLLFGSLPFYFPPDDRPVTLERRRFFWPGVVAYPQRLASLNQAYVLAGFPEAANCAGVLLVDEIGDKLPIAENG